MEPEEEENDTEMTCQVNLIMFFKNLIVIATQHKVVYLQQSFSLQKI